MAIALLPDRIADTNFPVTLAFSNDGRAFISERLTGSLLQVNQESYRVVKTFPVATGPGYNEIGLLGIVLDPDFEDNAYIYCYFTYGKYPNRLTNKVVRIKSDGTEEVTILDGIPGGWIHNGGILAFAPDKTLHIGTGVKNEIMERAQDLDYLGGKVLRINPDGTIPDGNPFPGSPIYSYGHRNIFGLAFHPKTGKLYVTENGPDVDDEVNIISKGGNYGWPITTGFSDDPKLIDPIKTYTPNIAPTQCVFVDGYFYFGSYNEGTVHRLTLAGENFDQVTRDDIVYWGSREVIGVFYGPDKQFYVTTPKEIARFKPEASSSATG